MPYDIGRAMLRGDFAKAVELLMTSQGDNRSAGAAAYAVLRSSCDAGQALKHLEQLQGGRLQHLLLKALQRYGADAYAEALRALPHGTRCMFLQAYQSLVFNRCASRRLRMGRQVIAGDLVFVGAQALKRKRLLSLLAAVSSEGQKQEEAAGESRGGGGGGGAGKQGGTVNKKRRCLGGRGRGGEGEGGTGSMLKLNLTRFFVVRRGLGRAATCFSSAGCMRVCALCPAQRIFSLFCNVRALMRY